jgi:hypothetical protein
MQATQSRHTSAPAGNVRQTLTPAQIERLLRPQPVPPAYFTLPIKRLEEPTVAPRAARKPVALLSTALAVALMATVLSGSQLLRTSETPTQAAAVAAPTVAVATAEIADTQPAAQNPGLPRLTEVAAEELVAPSAVVVAEVETTAGPHLADRVWTRQRPGVGPVHEEPEPTDVPVVLAGLGAADVTAAAMAAAFHANEAVPNPLPVVESLPVLMEASQAPNAVRTTADTETTVRLVRRGDAYLMTGDVISARLTYMRAAEQDDPQAMMALGQTYDPVVLRKLGTRGIRPEPELAQHWYNRAAAATPLKRPLVPSASERGVR